MVKIANYLDFNLQAYQERVGLVNFLDEQGILQQCSPSELDKVANYLLYSEDVDAEVELKEGSKKKVSYEELIESTLGENLVQYHDMASIYKIPRPTIDREKDADIPFMKDLWEAIDWVTERYQYCKDVLEGKRDLDTSRALIPTYQTKYFLREWMIDMRREQFLLKDSFRLACGSSPGFKTFCAKPHILGMKIGPHILVDDCYMVDYGNWQHIYNLLKYYNGMVNKINGDPMNDWYDIYNFLDELIDRIRWTPEQEIILKRKINKVPNEDIVRELEGLGYKSYSVNYISTIFKQHISKRIVKMAYLWWNEHEYKPDGTLRTLTKWKICDKCGRQLFADEINFGKYIDGSWKEVCKDCVYKEKLDKEKKRREKKNVK